MIKRLYWLTEAETELTKRNNRHNKPNVNVLKEPISGQHVKGIESQV